MQFTLDEHDLDLIADKVAERLKPLLQKTVKQTNEDDPIFSVKEVAEYLRVDTSFIYKKIQFKEIPHLHVGKYPRFRKGQIDKWLASQTVKPILT